MKTLHSDAIFKAAKIRKLLRKGKKILFAGTPITHARSKRHTLKVKCQGKYCEVGGDGSPLLFLS